MTRIEDIRCYTRRINRLRREAARLDLIGDHNAAHLLRARAALWYRTYRLHCDMFPHVTRAA